MQKASIRVLIADDHPLFRQGILALFAREADIEVIDEAVNGDEVIWKAQAHQPDVLLLDIGMPDTDSFNVARSVHESSPQTRILFLTMYDDEEQYRRAMEAGARGYVLKDSPPAQIVTAVREISRGASDLTPRGLTRLVADLQALARANDRWARSALLTPRENEILRLFAEGGTARQIAMALDLSIKTVEAHKFNLMRKLDIHNRSDLIDFAVQNHLVPMPCGVPSGS